MTGATASGVGGNETEVNQVRLVGRLSGEVTRRELPSGDELVSFRVVVARSPHAGGRGTRAGAGVDTIDIACWSAGTRRAAGRLVEGDGIAVEGSLRRRFFATPTGRASRYEVEARTVRRTAVPARPAARAAPGPGRPGRG